MLASSTQFMHFLQSSALCKKINAVHVSTEVLLDDELSDDAAEAKKLIANSQPVPDDIWVCFVFLLRLPRHSTLVGCEI